VVGEQVVQDIRKGEGKFETSKQSLTNRDSPRHILAEEMLIHFLRLLPVTTGGRRYGRRASDDARRGSSGLVVGAENTHEDIKIQKTI
jgi:hypothetical protein